jgi:hypothetical protein
MKITLEKPLKGLSLKIKNILIYHTIMIWINLLAKI